MMANEPTHAHFFISYTGKDSRWAEWIAMQLEEAGYLTIIQAWDFRPGSNFVAEMDEAAKRAERTLLVLSPAYLESDYAFAEWATAFRHDPRGKQGRVLPVRIQRCEVEGLLGPIVYIDLVDLDEARARERLLAGVQRGRDKPVTVAFPASASLPVPLDRPAFPGSLPSIWNVPYPRNPLFTGREELLTQLATALQADQPTAISQPEAISGLGGIGKTQLALEYAYRFRQNYQAVLWAQADTREALTASFHVIAVLLSLPEKEAQKSEHAIAAVKDWLQTHTHWLLILDNADDLALARAFLPPTSGGHLLLTTRAQAMGRFARHWEVENFPTEQAALFLLYRSGLLAPNTPLEQATEHERDTARAICEELGGLPLALDQAGAYIEETGCSLADYQHRYQLHRADLLAERRGLIDDHPLPVATTWSLSFELVKVANPAAADLLRLCAFLAPDAIPEAIITKGAPHLGTLLAPVGADPYLLDQAIEALRAYSLLQRDTRSGADNLLSMHRLVQAVLKDQMDKQSRQQWAERTVHAVYAALPDVEHETWPQWERILVHAIVCTELIEQQGFHFAEAAHFLQQTGWYLTERARYSAAEPLLEQAYQMSEQEQGAEHLDTARDASTLAELYYAQGKFEQAEPLYVRALAIYEQQLGLEHPVTQIIRGNYIALLRTMGRDAEAVALETKRMPPL